MRISMIALCTLTALIFSACERKVVQNTAIGGAIGAAAGEVIWDKPVEGALVGGAIGAATAIE